MILFVWQLFVCYICYMESFWSKDGKEPVYETTVSELEDGLFHCGQIYEDTPAKTLQCKLCGSKEFNVGTGNYFTAIKCKNCEYELCIHDG